MKKLIKPIVCLVILLVVIALTTSCVDKATGGGWFIDEDGHKCTFGFNAIGKGEGEDWTYTGQFQFKDYATGQKIHLKVMGLISFDDTSVYFGGYDKDGIPVVVFVEDLGEPGVDAGDCIAIWYNPDPETFNPDIDPPDWYGTLGGGNIQAH